MADRITSGARQAFGAITTTGGTLGMGSSYLAPILGGIAAVAIVAIIVFAVIQMNTGKPAAFTKGPIDLFQPTSPVLVSRTDTQKSMKASYTLAFYLRVDAVPDMRTSAVPLLTWPGVWNLGYNPAQEQLVWSFYQTAEKGTDTVTVTGVTLQRWNQIVMTVEGRSVDMYVNGILVTSTLLNNLPPSAAASITVVPGEARGSIAYVQAWPRRFAIGDVGANYTDTSDSQGRPLVSASLMPKFPAIPGLSTAGGETQPLANKSQTWEFPYQ